MKATILQGDVLDRLRELPDESVQCCVTSPPYWGLRDYGIPPSVWGGDSDCVHDWADASWKADRWGEHDDDTPGTKQRTNGGSLGHRGGVKEQSVCSQCGAWLGCFGLEPTPELYTEHAVMIFREVRRVLRSDGVLWLNVGDSYAGSWGAQSRGGAPSESSTLQGNGHIGGGPKLKSLSTIQILAHPKFTSKTGSLDRTPGLKPKDIIGIPWMLAFALRADGWYLRGDHVWGKPNGMPESVEDRPTRAHEYVFLLAKSERYFYDHEAVRTAPKASTETRLKQDVDAQEGSVRANGGAKTNGNMKAVARKTDKQRGHSRRHDGFNDRWDAMEKAEQMEDGANLRSIWWISPAQYAEAHFAVMPERLAEICILAGTKVGDTVLDPFGGSGTTGVVALRYHRNAILIEIKPAYAEMGRARVNGEAPMFNTVEIDTRDQEATA